MNIVISGSRHFDNFEWFDQKMCSVLTDIELAGYSSVDTIFYGDATGIDACAQNFARKHNIKSKKFFADWAKYGNSAGPIRNGKMLSAASRNSKSLLIAFPNSNINYAKGTMNCVKQAISMCIDVLIFPIK